VKEYRNRFYSIKRKEVEAEEDSGKHELTTEDGTGTIYYTLK
jgi:hypothetical protein